MTNHISFYLSKIKKKKPYRFYFLNIFFIYQIKKTNHIIILIVVNPLQIHGSLSRGRDGGARDVTQGRPGGAHRGVAEAVIPRGGGVATYHSAVFLACAAPTVDAAEMHRLGHPVGGQGGECW